MTKKVVLKGRGVSERTARKIITLAKEATTQRQCPYRKGYVPWSIWTTAFKYKDQDTSTIYKALLKADVPCNVTQNSSTDYPGLLPIVGHRHKE